MIRFGVFEVDPDAGQLRKHGLKIKLADQPFSILTLLLEQPGKVVTREELQRRLWADDTFVDFDRGLNKAVNRLRETLGDSADAPRFIETLPKRGYRFIGLVDPVHPPILDGTRQTAVDTPMPQPAAPERSMWRPLAWGAAAVVALAALAMLFPRGSAPVEALVRASVLPPADASFVPYNFALSPDGRQLAFVSDRAGQRALWLPALSAVEPRSLSGTDDASFPFWAPDNQHIGFFANRKLTTIGVASGVVRIVADARRPSGGTWNADGTIVFAPDVSGPLYRVPASGGTPKPITTTADATYGESHRWPSFLPDGRHVLYSAYSRATDPSATGIFAIDVQSGERTPISAEAVRSVAFAVGHLFFARGGRLHAHPFDPVRLRTTGDPLPVAERDVATASAFFPSGFSISQTGVLAFQSSADLATRFTWMDEAGKELGHVSGETYGDPSLSPDGRLVAMSCDALDNGRLAICTYDLARNVAARVTEGTDARFPVWSHDGREIAYISNGDLYRVVADGSARARLVTRRGNPTSWSRDGRILLFGSKDGTLSLAMSSVVDGTITELGPGSEGQLSPDGAWIVHNGQDRKSVV